MVENLHTTRGQTSHGSCCERVPTEQAKILGEGGLLGMKRIEKCTAMGTPKGSAVGNLLEDPEDSQHRLLGPTIDIINLRRLHVEKEL